MSFISVAEPLSPGGLYRVIDGMHRLVAVRELIAEGLLPEDFRLICAAYKSDIPEHVAVDYATRMSSWEGEEVVEILEGGETIPLCVVECPY